MQTTDRLDEKPAWQLLDCTLRDGGYYTNWDFPWPQVDRLLRSLAQAGVRHFEVGYRAPAGASAGYKGEYYYIRPQLLRDIRTTLRSATPEPDWCKLSVAVMLNVKEVQPCHVSSLMAPCAGLVDVVRLATDPAKITESLAVAKALHEAGFSVALNLMYASRWVDAERVAPLQDQVATGVAAGHIQVINLVDSFGSLLPNQTETIFRSWRSRFPPNVVQLGFHGHDNLSLAFANALVAVSQGAELIDATITGMGRGAGNLRTELALAHRQMGQGLSALSDLEHEFLAMRAQFGWGTSLPYMISGVGDAPQATVMELMVTGRYKPSTVLKILRGQRNMDHQVFPSLASSRAAEEVRATCLGAIVVGGGPSVANHAAALVEFARQKSLCFIHTSSKFLAVLGAQHDSPAVPHVVVFPCQKPVMNSVNYSSVAACVVANEPRLPITVGEDLRQKLLQAPPVELTTDSHPATAQFVGSDVAAALFSRGSPVGLALGALLAIWPEEKLTKTYFCGWDGFAHPSSAEREVMLETQHLIARLGNSADGSRRQLISLTPSQYCSQNPPIMQQSSVYSLL